MSFMTYPKIETLFNRDPDTHKVRVREYRCEEFALVDRWELTEKIDGTNVRVMWDGMKVHFGGRTDRAQLQTTLLEYLLETFTAGKFVQVFDARNPGDGDEIVLFGEGYGPKIQKGGGNYRDTPAFRLFDVRVGSIWLRRSSVVEIAQGLGIEPVPLVDADVTIGEAIDYVKSHPFSIVAQDESKLNYSMEGIVARTDPPLLTRLGRRMVWKLKERDF